MKLRPDHEFNISVERVYTDDLVVKVEYKLDDHTETTIRRYFLSKRAMEVKVLRQLELFDLPRHLTPDERTRLKAMFVPFQVPGHLGMLQVRGRWGETLGFYDIIGTTSFATGSLQEETDAIARQTLIPSEELLKNVEGSSGIRLDTMKSEINRFESFQPLESLNVKKEPGDHDQRVQDNLKSMAGYFGKGNNDDSDSDDNTVA